VEITVILESFALDSEQFQKNIIRYGYLRNKITLMIVMISGGKQLMMKSLNLTIILMTTLILLIIVGSLCFCYGYDHGSAEYIGGQSIQEDG